MKIPGFKCRCAPRLNMFHHCRDPKIQAPDSAHPFESASGKPRRAA